MFLFVFVFLICGDSNTILFTGLCVLPKRVEVYDSMFSSQTVTELGVSFSPIGAHCPGASLLRASFLFSTKTFVRAKNLHAGVF